MQTIEAMKDRAQKKARSRFRNFQKAALTPKTQPGDIAGAIKEIVHYVNRMASKREEGFTSGAYYNTYVGPLRDRLAELCGANTYVAILQLLLQELHVAHYRCLGQGASWRFVTPDLLEELLEPPFIASALSAVTAQTSDTHFMYLLRKELEQQRVDAPTETFEGPTLEQLAEAVAIAEAERAARVEADHKIDDLQRDLRFLQEKVDHAPTGRSVADALMERLKAGTS